VIPRRARHHSFIASSHMGVLRIGNTNNRCCKQGFLYTTAFTQAVDGSGSGPSTGPRELETPTWEI